MARCKSANMSGSRWGWPALEWAVICLFLKDSLSVGRFRTYEVQYSSAKPAVTSTSFPTVFWCPTPVFQSCRFSMQHLMTTHPPVSTSLFTSFQITL